MQTANNSNKTYLGYLLVLICVLCWGILGVIMKRALLFIDPYTITWFRFLLSFILLLITFAIYSPKEIKILRCPPMLGIVGAVFLLLNYLTYILSVQYAGAVVTQVVIQLGPVFLAIFGRFFLKEDFRRVQWLGLGLAVTGLLLFQSDKLINVGATNALLHIGIVLTIISAFTWSIWGATQKLLIKSHLPQTLNLLTFGISTLLLLPFVEIGKVFTFSLDPFGEPFLLLVVLGLNTFIAYGALVASFKYLPISRASVITTLTPIVTIIALNLSAFMFPSWVAYEAFSIIAYAGALVILLGVGIVVGTKS